mmetsp:Transcript_15980/g.40999  ORF Transcript_15980/g.40999 Transcript_15980/m.40999 type:complete len:332 (+) Transcript_15980:660-1655(+)
MQRGQRGAERRHGLHALACGYSLGVRGGGGGGGVSLGVRGDALHAGRCVELGHVLARVCTHPRVLKHLVECDASERVHVKHAIHEIQEGAAQEGGTRVAAWCEHTLGDDLMCTTEKRKLAGGQHVEAHAERPHVHLGASVGKAAPDLGRGVVEAASAALQFLVALPLSGEAPVAQKDVVTAAVQHDVLELEIAMHIACTMREAHGFAHLAKVLARELLAESLELLYQLQEVTASTVLLHQVAVPVILHDVVHGRDVLVCKQHHHKALLLQVRMRLEGVTLLYLDGHAVTRHQIVRLEDARTCASTQSPSQLEAVVHQPVDRRKGACTGDGS